MGEELSEQERAEKTEFGIKSCLCSRCLLLPKTSPVKLLSGSYAMMSLTTRPWTSVRRKSRPE
jgi:hypothetical protein